MTWIEPDRDLFVEDRMRKAHDFAHAHHATRVFPAVALSLLTVLILATSVLALPQTAREKIFEQLPFDIPSTLTALRPQHPSTAPTQLAAAATSFPNYLKEKIRNAFCWWRECEESGGVLAQQNP